ncbi:MAG: hypothetical protein IPH30_11780 [Betaproteobacteria bacterium]|nr:hypothetical protein [Betaproteobacteria bacterium]
MSFGPGSPCPLCEAPLAAKRSPGGGTPSAALRACRLAARAAPLFGRSRWP